VIRSFKDAEAEALFSGRFSQPVAAGGSGRQRKLQQLHAARELRDLAAFLATGSRRSQATGVANTAFGSTISIASASSGTTGTLTMWRSWTITSAGRK
jgi:hypothetical protein